jgi:DNA gyrase subunit A
LDEGDGLIGVVLTRPGDEVMLSSRNGMAIRFAESDARAMGRNAYGVKGINLAESDAVIGVVVADPEGFLLTVCENGYGKRTPFGPNAGSAPVDGADEEPSEPDAPEPAGEEGENGDTADRTTMRYRLQRRGGKGLRDIRTSDRNGPVIGVVSVRDGDDVMLITQQGMVNRTHATEIRITGRNAQGVRVMNLNEGDRLASVAKVAREEGVEGEEPPAPPPPAT